MSITSLPGLSLELHKHKATSHEQHSANTNSLSNNNAVNIIIPPLMFQNGDFNDEFEEDMEIPERPTSVRPKSVKLKHKPQTSASVKPTSDRHKSEKPASERPTSERPEKHKRHSSASSSPEKHRTLTKSSPLVSPVVEPEAEPESPVNPPSSTKDTVSIDFMKTLIRIQNEILLNNILLVNNLKELGDCVIYRDTDLKEMIEILMGVKDIQIRTEDVKKTSCGCTIPLYVKIKSITLDKTVAFLSTEIAVRLQDEFKISMEYCIPTEQ